MSVCSAHPETADPGCPTCKRVAKGLVGLHWREVSGVSDPANEEPGFAVLKSKGARLNENGVVDYRHAEPASRSLAKHEETNMSNDNAEDPSARLAEIFAKLSVDEATFLKGFLEMMADELGKREGTIEKGLWGQLEQTLVAELKKFKQGDESPGDARRDLAEILIANLEAYKRKMMAGAGSTDEAQAVGRQIDTVIAGYRDWAKGEAVSKAIDEHPEGPPEGVDPVWDAMQMVVMGALAKARARRLAKGRDEEPQPDSLYVWSGGDGLTPANERLAEQVRRWRPE